MGLTDTELNKSLYGNLNIKQAKGLIDDLEDDTAELLLIRILCLRQAIELDLCQDNPLFEALADFDDKQLGLLVQYISRRDQFKSRKKKAAEDGTPECPL